MIVMRAIRVMIVMSGTKVMSVIKVMGMCSNEVYKITRVGSRRNGSCKQR
jgi:hypothetical protein